MLIHSSLLDDLEEDLLLELDEVVRANQLACLPFAKSGEAELLLHKRHPSLAQEIDVERQRNIRDMAFRSSLKEEDNRLSFSFRTRVGSLDDIPSSSPSQDKLSRKLKSPRIAPFSPSIRPRDSAADLMFDMDEDSPSLEYSASPIQRPSDWTNEPLTRAALTESNDVWHDSRGKVKPPVEDTPKKETGSLLTASKPWSLPAFPSSRVDMRDIMAQASAGRTSSLSLGLSAQMAKENSARNVVTPKISQKERKKQKRQAQQQTISQPQHTNNKISTDPKTSSPWQLSSTGAKISLNDVIVSEATSSPPAKPPQPSSSLIPPLDLSHRRTASPDTRFAGQHRCLNSSASIPKDKRASNSPRANPLRRLPQPQLPMSTPLIPHSKSYANPAASVEPPLQLAMVDIIGQQKREQDLIKEAVAKRSLQEIQEEQAFQEWWDKESQKAQEEEALRKAGNTNSERGGSGSAKGKGNKGGERAGRPRRRGDGANNGGRWQGRGKGMDKRSVAD
jgi:inhibitor of Bruton tyrosine kinase